MKIINTKEWLKCNTPEDTKCLIDKAIETESNRYKPAIKFFAACSTYKMLKTIDGKIDNVMYWEAINKYEDELKMYAKEIRDADMIEESWRMFPVMKDELLLYIELIK